MTQKEHSAEDLIDMIYDKTKMMESKSYTSTLLVDKHPNKQTMPIQLSIRKF